MRKQQPRKRATKKAPVIHDGIAYNASAAGLYSLRTLASLFRKPMEVLSTGFAAGERSVRNGVKAVNKLDTMAR